MQLGEKTISSREVFSGRIIKLRVDSVTLPDGNISTREIVEHSGAVAIVAVDNGNMLWMVRQYRRPLEKVLLEIPAGTLEEGEDPLSCAQRELAEETGLRAENWEKILEYYSVPGFCDEKLHLFLATELTEGQSNLDHDEFLEVDRIPLQQAYDSIFAGQIADGKSIIGIQYAVGHFLAGK
ncbi:MAG: NUDIX hydrolase [Syntrophomonadaceae bacterium]|nr:NUDIX hydrolase [Syntrophomonadaceae bacterium]